MRSSAANSTSWLDSAESGTDQLSDTYAGNTRWLNAPKNTFQPSGAFFEASSATASTAPRPIDSRRRAPLTEAAPGLQPTPNSPRGQIAVLGEWNGCVLDIDQSSSYFTASLKGVLGEGIEGEEEDALIPVSDVSDWDLELLKPGNFFRLSVIHEIQSSGQPRRYTQVVFRRLPAYRQQDLDVAGERARQRSRALRVE